MRARSGVRWKDERGNVNKFTVGATVLGVNLYDVPGECASVHVLLSNGAMLVVHGEIDIVDMLGPSEGPEVTP